MKITTTMDLNQLPELLALRLNHHQMEGVRHLLNETRYTSLAEVPEPVWQSILESVQAQSQFPGQRRS